MGFDFTSKKSRLEIVQNIIEKKNFKKYLEIGCFDDELFSYIQCEKKIGDSKISTFLIPSASRLVCRDLAYSRIVDSGS